MSSKLLKLKAKTVRLDAKPDRPDIRDRMYQPPLRSPPDQYPSPEKITQYLPAYCKDQLVLDQGQEGACTGFGLAAVINYLLFLRRLEGAAPVKVSERMLYHLARKYDEWPGEDYEGSSCRGAIKGWFHHGVCSDQFWPYRDTQKRPVFIRPKDGWDADAALRPLGAYYRIDTESVADMQAAIYEVGAIYVSSDVHAGWDLRTTRNLPLPTIKWKPGTKPDGGHAFALVGYDREGFIVQNSWGPSWGYLGFARLLYDDWLTNGTDAWAAVLGVPIAARAPSIILSSGRTVPKSTPYLANGLVNGATAEIVSQPVSATAWSTAEAVKHCLVLGNQGLPDQVTIDDENGSEAAQRVCLDFPKAWLEEDKSHKRIAVYVHGGLNDLRDGIQRARVMGPWFEKNGIYPIFVVWQSGYFDSLSDIVCDVVGRIVGMAEPRKRSLVDRLSDARDQLIEAAAIPAARPVWSEMKENAIGASTLRNVNGQNGGMVILADALKKLGKVDVHLVGHSAGAIVLGAFLAQMKRAGLSAASVSLYAPACTVRFALDTYVPAIGDKVIDAKRLAFEILSNKNEENDTVGEVYGKSLLYLVSRALEPLRKTPLLGMEAVWDDRLDRENIFGTDANEAPHPDVAAWRQAWSKVGTKPDVLIVESVVDSLKPKSSIKSSHGCFDNWIACVERTLLRILNLSAPADLPVRITTLHGF